MRASVFFSLSLSLLVGMMCSEGLVDRVIAEMDDDVGNTNYESSCNRTILDAFCAY